MIKNIIKVDEKKFDDFVLAAKDACFFAGNLIWCFFFF